MITCNKEWKLQITHLEGWLGQTPESYKRDYAEIWRRERESAQGKGTHPGHEEEEEELIFTLAFFNLNHKHRAQNVSSRDPHAAFSFDLVSIKGRVNLTNHSLKSGDAESSKCVA